MNPSSLGPMKVILNGAAQEIELLGPLEKHWFCGGKRSIGIAVEMLRQCKIIAIPTDTIYGLAGIVSNSYSIEQLYKIKKREENKPLAICVGSVKDVNQWGVTDHISPDILPSLLPGPYTVILKRTSALNPDLNPGIDTVGIRVPDFTFVRSVATLIGPLALTSANLSNQPSCLEASEFSDLWPQIDGIFYHLPKESIKQTNLRKGSTIVDLSRPGYYTIVRSGVGARYLKGLLKHFNIKPYIPG